MNLCRYITRKLERALKLTIGTSQKQYCTSYITRKLERALKLFKKIKVGIKVVDVI